MRTRDDTIHLNGRVAKLPEPMTDGELRDIQEYLKRMYGWSKSSLAEYLDVNLTTIQRWEHREHPVPRACVIALRALRNMGFGKLTEVVTRPVARSPA